MSERIVVSFFMAHAGLLPVTGRGYVGRSRALVKRAESLGGALIAFGAQLLAFSFDRASLESSITLAVAAVTDETHEGEIGWACGLAEGAHGADPVDPEAPHVPRPAAECIEVPVAVRGDHLDRFDHPSRRLVA